MKVVYRNMKCLRCNGIVSQDVSGKLNVGNIYFTASNKTFHTKCKNRIEQEEDVCFVLVSFSDKPLDEAVEVISQTNQSEYDFGL